MIGLIAIAVFLLVALVVVAALGFVFLTVVSGIIGLLAKGAPVFGSVFRTAGLVVAAVFLAIASINFASEQAELHPKIFAFAQTSDTPVNSSTNSPVVDQTVSTDTDVFGVEMVVEKITRVVEPGERPAENPTTLTTAVSASADSSSADSSSADSPTADSPSAVDLPNWVTQGLATQPTVSNHESEYIVLKSDLKVLREEADQHIREQAAEIIRQDFTSHYATDVEWDLPDQVVEDAIRRSFYTTETVAITPKREHEMHRVYAQVALSPALRSSIYPGWRKLVASRRLVKLGQGFGLVTLVIMSLAMYLRYDKQTLGQKRGRLGLLSLAIFAGGSVVLGAIGDSIRSKLSAANIVEAEYCRDRIDQLDDTVIGLNEGPVFQTNDSASKIAIVIDGGQLNQAGLMRRQMADYIESLSPNIQIDIHVNTDRRLSTTGFQGGANAAKVQHAIEKLMSQRIGQSVSVSRALDQAFKSKAQSVFIVTDDLTNLTDRERRKVNTLAVRSNLVPVSFIKIFDGKPTRFDDALQSLASRSGGYLRLLDALDADE